MPSFRCEHCRQKIAARDAYAGRRVRCPRCRQAVRVPAEQDAPISTQPITAAPESGQDAISVPPPSDIVPEPAPVYTQRSFPRDFSTIFSAPLDSLFDPVDHDYSPEEQTQVLRPVHPHEDDPPLATSGEQTPGAPSSAPPIEFSGSNIPELKPSPLPDAAPVVIEAAEVIDAPAPMRSGLNSINEVADLLRGLDNPSHRARLAASSAAAAAAMRRRVADWSRPVRAAGWASLLIGVATIALTCLPALARYAIPTGAGGLLLAMTGLVIAITRRAPAGLPAGGAVASAAGIGVALLWGFGLLPWAARGVSEHVRPSSPNISGDVQVRVVSALLLRPAIYAGDYRSLRTAGERMLQITLEIRNLGGSHAVYRPWRRSRQGDDAVQLSRKDGRVLQFRELQATDPPTPVVLAASAQTGPVALDRVPVVSDVLLFEPPKIIGDLQLDLPGRNIGKPETTLHLQIPASMVRVQE
jgi:phage FluMu protein Com